MANGKENVVKKIFLGRGRRVLDLVSPPLCRGCGARGVYLCECCKKYITEHAKVRNLVAEMEDTGGLKEILETFTRAEYIGFRDEILGEMVEEYKYMGVRGLAREIAEILYEGYFREKVERLGRGEKILVVAMPTSKRHVRERGFDHCLEIAKEIERRGRGKVRLAEMLVRKKDTVQVGASEEVRRKQAKEAVGVNPEILMRDGSLREKYRRGEVILVDDVWTTGASMIEAGKRLREAGVEKARLSAIAITKTRQGLSPEVRRGELV